MGLDQFCDASLKLGLGFSEDKYKPTSGKIHQPSLTLGLSAADSVDNNNTTTIISNLKDDELHRQDSAASSFSNVNGGKRDREQIEETEDDGSNTAGKKKLRLTKLQSALLEESFKLQSTLNPKQKQDLARELKLRPRQIEVWFQNRRARTKLKQTEVDCELLKKCCETLTEENRRLRKEVQELKALKVPQHQQLYMQLPAATLTLCPSCDRLGAAAVTSFTITPKPFFYNPFTNPPAAC